MNEKKRPSMLKKGNDDETQTNIAEIGRKRRISFSGRKLVREFCGEEVTQAWKDSYEESDRSNNSATPQMGVTTTSIRVSDIKSFNQNQCVYDATNKENNPDYCKMATFHSPTLLSGTMDYINYTAHVGTLNIENSLDITLTEHEKKLLFPSQPPSQNKVETSNNKSISGYKTESTKVRHHSTVGDRKQEGNQDNKYIDVITELTTDEKQSLQNKRQTMHHNQPMDISFNSDKENIPVELLRKSNFDRNMDKPLTLSDSCTKNVQSNSSCANNKLTADHTDMVLDMNVSRKQLQNTMYYNNNDGLLHDPPPLHTEMSKRKTIVFNTTDIRSNVDICIEENQGVKSNAATTFKHCTKEDFDFDTSAKHVLKEFPMDISMHEGTLPNQLQNTMYYNDKIEDILHNPPVPQIEKNNRKTEVFTATDVRSNIDICFEENRSENPNATTFKAAENFDFIAPSEANVSKTNKTNPAKNNEVVVRKIVLKTTPAKCISNTNNKKYALKNYEDIPQKDEINENKDVVFKNDGNNDIKKHLKSCNLTEDFSRLDPFSPNPFDNNNSISGKLSSNKKCAISADNLPEKINTYKNKLPRYSQADEQLLDNTSYLTKAKLGDETASRNSSKYTPASSNKEHDTGCSIDSATNACVQTDNLSDNNKPYFCKSLDFTKMPESKTCTPSLVKENEKNPNQFDSTVDFAQPLSQTIIFDNNNANIDISTVSFNSPANEELVKKASQYALSVENSNAEQHLKSKGRRTILLSDDIQLDNADLKEYQNQVHKSSNKSMVNTIAKRRTILLCENIELVEEDGLRDLQQSMLSHTQKQSLPESELSANSINRQNILLQEDILPTEIANKQSRLYQQNESHTKHCFDNNINESNKQQNLILSGISLLKPNESVAIAEKEIAAQIQKSILTQHRQLKDEDDNSSIQRKPIQDVNKSKRQTTYIREDMLLVEQNNEVAVSDQQSIYNEMKNQFSLAHQRTIHFDEGNNITMDHLDIPAGKIVYDRTPSKAMSRMVTTPGRKFEYTPQRSIIEFENNERQIEMEMLMEDKDESIQPHADLILQNSNKDMSNHHTQRRQTTYQALKMDESYMQCPNTGEVTKKRLAYMLTPNVPISKKRQTHIFTDCALDESQANQPDNLVKRIEHRTILNDSESQQAIYNENNMVMSDSIMQNMEVSPSTKSLHPLMSEVGELQNRKLRTDLKDEYASTSLKPEMLSIQLPTASAKQEVNTIIEDGSRTPGKANTYISRIPVAIGSAKKNATNTPQYAEADVFIIEDDTDDLETIQNPRKAFAMTHHNSILPVVSAKFENQTMNDQHEHLQNTAFDVSKYRQSLNIMDFEGIDKTNISSVSITMDDSDIEFDCDVTDVTKAEKTDNLVEHSLVYHKPHINSPVKDITLCRKCKHCEDTILNDTTMVSFVLPKTPVVPLASLAKLTKLRKRPKLHDVYEYYSRLSLQHELSYQHDEKTIVLGTSLDESEDEADLLIRNYKERLEQNKTQTDAKLSLSMRYSFVERFDTLLKSHTNNWIFNYQVQNQNIYYLHHRKIPKTIAIVMHEAASALGKDIRVQRIQLQTSFITPEKNWKPIDHIMNFQLQLELTGADLMPVGDSEQALVDVMVKLNETFVQVERLSMILCNVAIMYSASLIRDGNQTYLSKVVRTTSLCEGEYPQLDEIEFRINIMNLKKICYKDIFLPPLHMFHENIQLMPTGLNFLCAFLKAPESHLRNRI